MSRPEFVDNRGGNTLAAALEGHLQHLALTLREPVRLDIATGYFNPEGFARIADALATTSGVRLLLGAEPVPPPARPLRKLGDPRGERFERKLTDEALARTEQGLLRDRDRLAFTPESDRAIRRLLEFLESGRIEVRRYERRFLHGKAYICSGGQGVVAGSSNFTAAGLATNLELNLGHYQPSVTEPVTRWFEELWEGAEPYDLAALYASRFDEYSPYLVYLRVLLERYGAELTDEAPPNGRIELTRFQNDGLIRARRMLEEHHGVLICDSVGLGKTFMAGELLRETIEQRRQRALLVAPAALRDGTWARFKARFQLGVEVKSFEQIADGNLDAKPEEYSLVVVDEAHAFRSLDTTRSQALRRLLLGMPPKNLVLMTATPVNNSLWDLYGLLSYFVGNEAVFAARGIPHLKRRFEEAAHHDPFTLKPDLLFDVLDATTVRRTRHFVKRFYAHDRVRLPNGEHVTIQFPTPHVRAVHYDLESSLPGFFAELAAALAPEDGEPALTMARYWPSRYRGDGAPSAREAALVGLLRSMLLKRFESSAHAFERTLHRMVVQHEFFLQSLEQGRLPDPDALGELAEAGSEQLVEELFDRGTPTDGTDYDVPRLGAAIENDLALLRRFHTRVAQVHATSDPKLELLVEELRLILGETEHEVLDDKTRRDRRKVLVFSQFKDTVEWIAAFLETRLESDAALAPYRGRLAVVRGASGYDDVGRREAVYGFAPDSTEAPHGHEADRFDILVTTDVLSEGMNLQQAARIINYDLPWNPMRLVQRHGRIDRIGSSHRDVYMTCVFPDQQLDDLLDLERRIRVKLAQAAASIGLDQQVIPGMEPTSHVFVDDADAIRKLREEDASIFERGGEDPHAHSGEEYRQELRLGLERYGERLRALPGAVGSGFARGTERGHFFCARIDDKAVYRFVPTEGEEVVRDALTCLARITCSEDTPRVLSEAMRESAYAGWARARADIHDEWMRATDPAELAARVRPLFRQAAAHLRKHRPEEMTLEQLDRLADTLEAPWLHRIEKSLREVFDPTKPGGVETSMRIAERVRALGLRPHAHPEPLSPIEPDDIVLVAWMAVEPEDPK